MKRSWVGCSALVLFATGCLPRSIEIEHDAGGAAGAEAIGGTDNGSGGTHALAGTGAASGARPEGGNGADAGTPVGGSGPNGTPVGGATAAGGRTPDDPPLGGSTALPDAPGAPCESACADGFECMRPYPFGAGICAPHCDADEADEQSEWGKSCSNPISGEIGVCRPVLRNVTDGSTAIGICTVDCDPLEQDCPERFACDITEDEAGMMANRVFQCLPVVEEPARQRGDACDGFPVGQCAPGLSCVQNAAGRGAFANCRVLCDSEGGDACEQEETCVVPFWFPVDTTVGVCATDDLRGYLEEG
jgi:hypothetical protein